MASFRRLLLVCLYAWSYCGLCANLHHDYRRNLDVTRLANLDKTHSQRDAAQRERDLHFQDTLTEHMQMLYTKYNQAGFSFKDGNTVRSFKALWGTINHKHLHIFNLTTLTKSESVLSATLHFFIGDLLNQTCPSGSRSCPRHTPRHHHLGNQLYLNLWSFGSTLGDNSVRTLGHVQINVSTLHRNFISWQWKDITRVVNEAKRHDELLIGVELVWLKHPRWKELLSKRSPYILVYANDSAISEPESVVATLQRHHTTTLEVQGKLENRTKNVAQSRQKRSVNMLSPLQNNELPGPEYPYDPQNWDEGSPYEPIDPNKQPNQRKTKKKTRKNQKHKVALLQFDDQTIKKARRKQWVEARKCARRYLKVDFADIGWSEWIISPKSFDAFYCSGSCQFPMPKTLKPSNHATIQSIVRAVGVVPGVPEPCCVPEKMSSLSILFFDEDKNVVLKVYPNMTVDSCACR